MDLLWILILAITPYFKHISETAGETVLVHWDYYNRTVTETYCSGGWEAQGQMPTDLVLDEGSVSLFQR